MIDVSPRDAYLIDVFRVAGGTEHAKFFRTHFGTLSTQGVPETSAPMFDKVPQMRNWRGGPAAPGWSADWKIEDRLKLLESPADLHVRYTDLTSDAQAYAGESWVSVCTHGFTSINEMWIPHLVTRRQASPAPLVSTFLSVIEDYETNSKISAIRRLPLQSAEGTPCADTEIAVELSLADGRRDLFVSRDLDKSKPTSQPSDLAVIEKQSGLKFDGQSCLLRRDARGEPVLLCLGRTRSVVVGPVTLVLNDQPEYVELALEDGTAQIVRGQDQDIRELAIKGKPVRWVP